ncbi:MAG TPA: MHYT domain-containing protein [Methyloceanibacter sp.]
MGGCRWLLPEHNNPYLVALSVLGACFASYTALDLGGRVGSARGTARRIWLAAAAITLGGGIWSMHFIGVLAFTFVSCSRRARRSGSWSI